MTIGERIHFLRKEVLKLTLEEFGERLGVKKNTLSTIENDKGNVTEQMRRSICREFSINEQWLLTGEGSIFPEKTKSAEIAEFVNTLSVNDDNFKMKLIVALARMTPDEWELLEKMIRRLADLDEEIAPVQQSVSVAQAEEEYIKSASEPVPPMAPAASNSTADGGNSETA